MAPRASDPALALLTNQTGDQPCLIGADENWAGFDWRSMAPATVVSNRHDIAAAAEAGGHSAWFNDFDFSPLKQQLFGRALLRVSKERPLCHHLINSLADALADGGVLWLCGAKQDGIKTHFKQATARFGGSAAVVAPLKKHGALYLGAVAKSDAGGALLDAQEYHLLRATAGAPAWQTKPGVFGWQKIDRGSELLINHWQGLVASGELAPPQRLLDLGCGYGYLGITALRGLATPIAATLTDNSATALLATRANLNQLSAAQQALVELVAADAGDQVEGQFDTLLCNPPFHQGFAVERGLTERFVTATARLLSRSGSALFVVNEFVPLERAAQGRLKCAALARSEGFQLFALWH